MESRAVRPLLLLLTVLVIMDHVQYEHDTWVELSMAGTDPGVYISEDDEGSDSGVELAESDGEEVSGLL